jgi:hypothetical protein
VKLHPTGRTIECDAGALSVRPGDKVMIDDRRGPLLAVVSVASAERPVRGPLGRILRRADERDLQRQEAHRQRESEAVAFARERARARKLAVKVFRAELSGDRALVYFSSDQRVDFRELVKDLAAHLHARIEMRQVGRARRGQDGGRDRLVRARAVLHDLPAPVRAGVDQDGQEPEPGAEPGQGVRAVRAAQVLPGLRRGHVRGGGQEPCPAWASGWRRPRGRAGSRIWTVLGGRIRVSYPDRPPAVFTADQVRPVALPGPPPAEPPDGDGDGDEVT